MYNISFFRDKNGNEPVRKLIEDLSKKKDKNSRINFAKITDYIQALMEHGTQLGEPYIKHLKGRIWELRPLRNRILFFGYDGNRIVLLSHFIKKTQKTPQREIEKAERLMQEYIERSSSNG